MAAKTLDLLATSRPFAGGVRDPRLAMEVAAIQRLAEDLARRLLTRDPLCERVRHRPYETAGLLALAVKDRLVGRRAGGGA
jgi:hypothetical protein